MKKIWITSLIAVLALFSLAACSGGDNTESSKKEETTESKKSEDNTGPVATVNGQEIPREKFNQQLEGTKQRYKKMGMKIEGKEKQMEQGVVNQLIGIELLNQKATEANIKVSKDEVEKKYEQFASQFPSEEERKKALKESGMTEDKVKQQLEENIKIQKYVAENTEEVTVSDEEAKKQYETMVKGQKNAPSFEEAKKQIKQQIQKQKQGQQVTKLVEKLRKEADVKVTL
ncbi:SurA N-terminal domain-containing protein [Halobacillus naozhouensis]|uniref:peptidylprolyl isomerase n=1 Tax=Halobacillus naozhouensis TaxID=554880 RepID=A0ABY8IUS8_9BACI|nr:SurA N-terminal domain-containing protein [Halobacillus naozhouensis]WFT73024.1 SurA N-terminal domain-containing protein [Halobacillus naozhouensis]